MTLGAQALWCKSHFSFLEGTSSPEALIETAQRLGIEALALTDRDGVYGIAEAHAKATELGLKLIVGAEVTLSEGGPVVLLAQNRDGYAHLCRLISVGRARAQKGSSLLYPHELCAHASGLIALVPDLSTEFIVDYKDAFGDRLYGLMTRHRLAEEVQREMFLRAQAQRYAVPLVASTEVLYHAAALRPLQDILTCIKHGSTVQTAGRLLRANAEHMLHCPSSLRHLFADDLSSLRMAAEVVEHCTFSLTEIRYRYPEEKLPNGKTSTQWLREVTFKGAQRRYQNAVPTEVETQLDKELRLIERLDYGGYFLTMWEIVEFCKAHNIFCQGRGSAANSAVCYCLGITAVDPVRMGLLFERFLSDERREPPDIDLDIEHERREEVIQHVYTRYGRSHAAMVANIVRYRSKSAVRDVGKALGIAREPLESLSKLLSHYHLPDEALLTEVGLDPGTSQCQHLLRWSQEILDVPRHLSIHPGGFLLGHEPISDLVPIEPATMPGRTVIQWDKYAVESLGLFKVDLLGLGALTHVHKALDLVRQHQQKDFSMATIPADDAATFSMISQGDTLGVFQIESRAQMSMLPRLRPKNFYDLVIEVSIVRPGPITGGMVHPYLRRRSGEEPVMYPHPSLEPVLHKTLGVPLFQEQVMRLAMVAADYTPGEADQLRRDMAAWRRSGRIERHRDRLIQRMSAKGIAPEFAERVFQQIRGFGEYGFPESHAASFALIAYVTAWLRCHYPAEFSCALLNAQPMGFYSPGTLVQDAQRRGVEVRPINVEHSELECTLEKGKQKTHAMRMGLRYVKGLGHLSIERILAARKAQPFRNLEDFSRRTKLPRNALEALAEAGALRCFKILRRQALWDLLRLRRSQNDALALAATEAPSTFERLSVLEEMLWDLERTAHSSRGHILAPLRKILQAQHLPTAEELKEQPDGAQIDYVGAVICRQRPGTASGVTFMTLEDETGFVNVVIWKPIFDAHHVIAKTAPLLGISGKLQQKDGVTHLVANSLWSPNVPLQDVPILSHDFH